MKEKDPYKLYSRDFVFSDFMHLTLSYNYESNSIEIAKQQFFFTIA